MGWVELGFIYFLNPLVGLDCVVVILSNIIKIGLSLSYLNSSLINN